MIIVILVSPRVNEILQISYVRAVQYKKTFLRVFHSTEISHENLIRTSNSNTLFRVSKTPDSFRCRFFYFYSVKSVSVSQLPTVSQDNPRTSI